MENLWTSPSYRCVFSLNLRCSKGFSVCQRVRSQVNICWQVLCCSKVPLLCRMRPTAHGFIHVQKSRVICCATTISCRLFKLSSEKGASYKGGLPWHSGLPHPPWLYLIHNTLIFMRCQHQKAPKICLMCVSLCFCSYCSGWFSISLRFPSGFERRCPKFFRVLSHCFQDARALWDSPRVMWLLDGDVWEQMWIAGEMKYLDSWCH